MSVRRALGVMASFKLSSSAAVAPLPDIEPRFLPGTGSCVYQGSQVKWYFDDSYEDPALGWSVPWDSTHKALARSAINAWGTLRREGSVGGNSAGTAVLQPIEVAAGTSGAFRVVRLDGAGGGSTNCSTQVIKIDVNDADYRYVAGHEVGHAFGIPHTGTQDQLTSQSNVYDLGTQRPLMASCFRPTGTDWYKGRSDDQAAVWDAALGSISPDGGFESLAGTPVAFKLGSGATFDSSVSYAGDRSMKLPPSAFIEQRIRLTDQSISSVSASTRYKTVSGANTTFKLMARPVTYPNYPRNCTGQNQLNYPQPESSWTWVNSVSFLSPGSSWAARSVSLSVSAGTAGDIDVFVSNQNSTETLWVDTLAVNS